MCAHPATLHAPGLLPSAGKQQGNSALNANMRGWIFELVKALPEQVRIRHCVYNEEVMQIIHTIPTFAVISSARFGQALSLFEQLKDAAKLFMGPKILWSRVILGNGPRAASARKSYSKAGVFCHHQGSWSRVLRYLEDVMAHGMDTAAPAPAAEAATAELAGQEEQQQPKEETKRNSKARKILQAIISKPD